MIVTKEFEAFPFKYNGQNVFCWFRAEAKIEVMSEGNDLDSPIMTESKLIWVDVSALGYCLNDLGEDEIEGTPELRKELERVLDIYDFEF
jgi:hypothetical protein